MKKAKALIEIILFFIANFMIYLSFTQELAFGMNMILFPGALFIVLYIIINNPKEK